MQDRKNRLFFWMIVAVLATMAAVPADAEARVFNGRLLNRVLNFRPFGRTYSTAPQQAQAAPQAAPQASLQAVPQTEISEKDIIFGQADQPTDNPIVMVREQDGSLTISRLNDALKRVRRPADKPQEQTAGQATQGDGTVPSPQEKPIIRPEGAPNAGGDQPAPQIQPDAGGSTKLKPRS